jgi:hypothetical protein
VFPTGFGAWLLTTLSIPEPVDRMAGGHWAKNDGVASPFCLNGCISNEVP